MTIDNPSPGIRCRTCFTLIELLVVVAIIAVLVALLLPALNQARSLARSNVCLSNLKNLGMAMGHYENDWNDYIPRTRYHYDNTQNDGSWDTALWPYLQITAQTKWTDTTRVIFHCPTDDLVRPYGPTGPRSYMINDEVSATTTPDPKCPPGKQWTRFPNSSHLILLACEPYQYSYIGYDLHTNKSWDTWHYYCTFSSQHNRGTNFLMVDGHAQRLEATDVSNWAAGTFDIPWNEGNRRWWWIEGTY